MKKGDKMRTGDLIAKLARGDRLRAGEIDALRLKLNEQDNVISRFGSYLVGSKLSIPGREEDVFLISDHPLLKVHRTTPLDFPNNTDVIISYESADIPFGNNNGWSVDLDWSANQFFAPEDGLYSVSFWCTWSIVGGLTGHELLTVQLPHNNSANEIIPMMITPVINEYVNISTVLYLKKGDGFYSLVHQDSGSDLHINIATLCAYRVRGIQNN